MQKRTISQTELKEEIVSCIPGLIELRHKIHLNPELRFQEKNTAALIRSWLDQNGISYRAPYIETDTVGLVLGTAGGKATGSSAGKNITLRADMDALPLTEESGKAWQSTVKGKAHSCGHDGHTAMLLGAVTVLHRLRDSFNGSVRFVFQPAEEGIGGGKKMVSMGLLDEEPKPDAVFALHGWIGLPVGSLSTRKGLMMAATDRFTIVIRGRGGHGARPHKSIDSIVIAAQVVEALQTVVSRNIDPLESAVISIGKFQGGEVHNVLPEKVFLEGTTRYFLPEYKEYLKRRIEEITAGICSAGGADYHYEYIEEFMPLVNDERMVDFAETVVKKYVGEDRWISSSIPRTMGAEDFSYYVDKVPGALLRLGLGENSPELHNPAFDFNDEAMEAGITTLCALALDFLR